MTEKKTKSSAYYQQQYRQRLRDQGLVKKEIWILPSRAAELQDIEKSLREPVSLVNIAAIGERRGERPKIAPKLWTPEELCGALSNTEMFKEDCASAELIDGEEPCLLVTMREFGDLPVFLSVIGDYLLAEALLWPVDMVKDPAAFNREALKLGRLFPLSYISISLLGAAENYVMYGALSATSLLSNVVFEIETLADNVMKAVEVFGPHLKTGAPAAKAR